MAVLEKLQKYHKLSAEFIASNKHIGKGRPTKTAVKEVVGYNIVVQILVNEIEVAKAKNKCGKFIITSV